MKILFLGDLFYDYTHIQEDMERIIEYIREKDYKVILNFETTIGSLGKPIKKRGPNLRSTDVLIDILKRMNCIAVCLANNHAMDFGEGVLADGMRKLQEAGIQCVGAGANLDDAIKPIELTLDGERIILYNAGWDVEETVYAGEKIGGCASLDRKRIVENIRQCRQKNGDARIISVFHWGFEFNTLPMPLDIDFAHRCVDAGCDLIIGHHPHVTQPVEVYGRGKIYYSLGNFYLSSLREKYETNYSNEFCNNFVDYGLAVVYDLRTHTYSEFMVKYDRSSGRSEIAETIDPHVLRNLPAIDWKSNEYLKQVRFHAYKPNPILTLNEEQNQKELTSLMRKYWIAEKIGFLKKGKLGKKLYEFLKSRGR